MNRIKKIITIYTFLYTISFFITSCCNEKIKIIGNGEFYAYDNYSNGFNQIDTIETESVLLWSMELMRFSMLKNADLIQNCNAMTCDEDYENDLIESSFTITCNKDFVYNTVTIPMGTDFSTLEDLEVEILKETGVVNISFTKEFMIKSNFETGQNELNVNIRTNDNITLKNSLIVFIKD